MDSSEDATFAALGGGAVIPAPGNDVNGLLTYTLQDKRRQRERQRRVKIFQCDLMTFKGTFFGGHVIVSPWYSLALQTVFFSFIQTVIALAGGTFLHISICFKICQNEDTVLSSSKTFSIRVR